MSSLDILAMASPEARYYKRDRDIMEDYDTKINEYNTALEAYKPLAAQYQSAIDSYNEQVNAFNTGLEKYKADAAAFNEAIAKYNEGPRTTPYEEMDYYVERPADFTLTQPEFTGGDEPVAPEDPGFTGEDVDAFVEQAGQRAQRRGATMATAQNIMTNPQGNYAVGVDSTVPEFSFSSMAMAEGGAVPDLPFANSIVAPAQISGIGQLVAAGPTAASGTLSQPLLMQEPQSYNFTYEQAKTRQSQRDIKSPAEAAAIKAAIDAGPSAGMPSLEPPLDISGFSAGRIPEEAMLFGGPSIQLPNGMSSGDVTMPVDESTLIRKDDIYQGPDLSVSAPSLMDLESELMAGGGYDTSQLLQTGGPTVSQFGPPPAFGNQMTTFGPTPTNTGSGIGGLFEAQFQPQGGGGPLSSYQSYLMNNYGQRAVENIQQGVKDDVAGFVDLVRQAEDAHFGGRG
ncbi:MAG: hypothetical protein VW715_09020 [Rhodospirillales bacterium]